MKKALYFLNLIWLYPVIGVAFMCSKEYRTYRRFHGAGGVWYEVKQAWRPK